MGYTTLVLLALPKDAGPEAVANFFESRLSPEWQLVSRVDEPPFAAGPIFHVQRAVEPAVAAAIEAVADRLA